MLTRLQVVVLLTPFTAPVMGAPLLSYTATDLGDNKAGFTVRIDWNDALTASGFFLLTAEGAELSTVQQQQGSLNIPVNIVSDALIFNVIDSGYRSQLDSWWHAGVGTPFSTATPPFGGVAPGSGNIGSNFYSASFGTAPATPVSGSTDVLYLVLNHVDGVANGHVSGIVSRNGADYEVEVALRHAVPEPGSVAYTAAATLGWFALRFRRRSGKPLAKLAKH